MLWYIIHLILEVNYLRTENNFSFVINHTAKHTFKTKIAEHNNYKEIEFLKKVKNICFCYLKIIRSMPKLRHEITKHKLFKGNMGPLLNWTDSDPQCSVHILRRDQIVKRSIWHFNKE